MFSFLIFAGSSLEIVIQNGYKGYNLERNPVIILLSFMHSNIYMVRDSKLKSSILLVEKSRTFCLT